MANPRPIGRGRELVETMKNTLLGDMKQIMEREKPLEEKLSRIFEEKRTIAAIAAVATITQGLQPWQ